MAINFNVFISSSTVLLLPLQHLYLPLHSPPTPPPHLRPSIFSSSIETPSRHHPFHRQFVTPSSSLTLPTTTSTIFLFLSHPLAFTTCSAAVWHLKLQQSSVAKLSPSRLSNPWVRLSIVLARLELFSFALDLLWFA